MKKHLKDHGSGDLVTIKVVNSLQIDLQVQCTLYQNPNCLSLGRTDKLILKIHMGI